MDTQQSPLLVKYLKNHVNNPESKAFAPLAEAYRKIGKIDKAMELLRQGLQRHPGYISALITLAQCHQDKNRNDLAYSTLQPVMEKNLENILLLKTFALACEKTNRPTEAMQTYKYLLFLNPRSEFYAERVEYYEKANLKLDESEQPDCEMEPVFDHSQEDVDAWEAQAFFAGPEKSPEVDLNLDVITEPETDLLGSLTTQTLPKEPKDNLGATEVNPVMTLTLVDLYCEQGIWDKAHEVLVHLHGLRPEDDRVKAKLAKVKEHLGHVDEGHNNLMDLIDKKLGSDEPAEELELMSTPEDISEQISSSEDSENISLLTTHYENFLAGIRSRSQSKLA